MVANGRINWMYINNMTLPPCRGLKGETGWLHQLHQWPVPRPAEESHTLGAAGSHPGQTVRMEGRRRGRCGHSGRSHRSPCAMVGVSAPRMFCSCSDHIFWLNLSLSRAEPLLARLKEDRTLILTPVFDKVEFDDLTVTPYFPSADGFDWAMWCMYERLRPEWYALKDQSQPAKWVPF